MPDGLYGLIVLRRSASFLAVLAVVGAPAVTSTRLFCRFTGQEIVGCAEAAAPEHAQVREGACCQERTFRALPQLSERQFQSRIPGYMESSAAGRVLAKVHGRSRWPSSCPPGKPSWSAQTLRFERAPGKTRRARR